MRITAGRAVLSLAGLFVLMQVIIPARTNPSSDPAMHFRAVRPDAVAAAAILDRSCRDCHSNDTTWPLYSRIAPVSWLVAHDVNEGRAELNLSEFGTWDAKKQQHKLEELCTQVTEGEMPMWIYTVMHPGTTLRPGEAETLCALSQPPASTR